MSRMRHFAPGPVIRCLVAVCALYALEAHALSAPNIVPVSDRLVTSGQPTRDSLAALSAEGFQAVVYLAPSTVADAIRDEPDLLAKQGIEFVHIPIPFNAPTVEHAESIAAALERLKDKKTLVHCQVNMRASTMVFLYRATRLHENPSLAYESVSRVWEPSGPWKRLIQEQLSKYGIKFEPF